MSDFPSFEQWYAQRQGGGSPAPAPAPSAPRAPRASGSSDFPSFEEWYAQRQSGEPANTSSSIPSFMDKPVKKEEPDFWGRLGKIFTGSSKGYGASQLNTAGAMQGLGNQLHRDSNEQERLVVDSGYSGYATDPLAASLIAESMKNQKRNDGTQGDGGLKTLKDEEKKLYKKADELAENSASDLAEAKRGLGTIGQGLVDLGANAVQMGYDAAGRALGFGMLPFASRAFGGAAQEARQEGANAYEAAGYGTLNMATELATEKLFDGLAGAFGKGTADKVVERIASKATTDKGRTAIRILANAAGEGGEEVISSLLEPLWKKIYSDESLAQMYREKPEEVVYDFILGAAMGGFGGVASLINGENARKNSALREADAAKAVEAEVKEAPKAEAVEEVAEEAEAEEAPAPVEAPSPAPQKSEAQITIEEILSGTVSNSKAEKILGDAELRQAFLETAVGSDGKPIELKGTKSEQRKLIKDAKLKEETESATTEVLKSQEGLQKQESINTPPVAETQQEASESVEAEAPATKVEAPRIPSLDGDFTIKAKDRVAAPVGMTNDQIAEYGEEGVKYIESGQSQNTRTNENMHESLVQGFEDDPVFHAQFPNAELKGRAEKIFSKGADKARDELSQMIGAAKGGAKLKLEAVPLVKLVANDMAEKAQALAEAGDTEGAIKLREEARGLLVDVGNELTYAGQLGQANRIYRYVGPEGRLMAMEKIVDRLNSKLKLKKDIEISDELLERYNAASKDEQRDAVMEEMKDSIAKQIPSTMVEKLTALRYLNMLGNVKTQVRNVTGNVISYESRRLSNSLAAMMEAWEQKKNPEFERTKVLKVDSKLRDAGLKDFENVMAEVQGEGKYSETGEILKDIQGRRKIFKSKFLEKYRNLTNDVMDKGDVIFGKRAYANALAGWLQAHNISTEQWNELVKKNPHPKPIAESNTADKLSEPMPTGTVVKALDRGNYGYVRGFSNGKYTVDFTSREGSQATVSFFPNQLVPTHFKNIAEAKTSKPQEKKFAPDDIVGRARAYAIKEAQETTFRDNSPLAEALSKMRYSGDNAPLKAISTIGEAIMPFRKTPANVLTRAMEYSPLGFAGTALKVHNGKIETNSAEFLSALSKNLTGSGIMTLGYLLAKAGMARGAEGDDKLEDFQRQQGQQDWSIDLNKDGNSITLDWASPVAVPFFMGVQIAQAQKGDPDTTALWNMFTATSDVMLSMSMLQGVNDAFSNISKFGDSPEALPQFLFNSAANLVTQTFSNSMLRQAEYASQENRMSNYNDPNSNVSRVLQYPLAKLSSGIPGWDYNQAEYIDAWGRKQSNGGALERSVNSFINPSYIGKDRSTKVDKELERLYSLSKTTDNNEFGGVLPQRPKRSLEIEGQVLSTKEYDTYARVKGQQSLEFVEDFMDSQQYKMLNDEQRAEIIKNLYSLAGDKARNKVLLMRHDSGNMVDIKADKMGVDPADYFIAKEYSSMETQKQGSSSAWVKMNGIAKSNLDDEILDIFAEETLGKSQIKIYRKERASGADPEDIIARYASEYLAEKARKNK